MEAIIAALHSKNEDIRKYAIRIVGNIIAEEGEGQRSAPLRVQVKSGIYVARYLVALAIFFGIVAISGALGRAAFEKRRWGDSNLYEAQFGGDDDDDDD